jgi:TolB protein
MKQHVLLIIFVFFLCLIVSGAVSAADNGVAVVNISGNQTHPDIYGQKVVWTDERNGNPDIYMKDLSTNKTVPITTNPAKQMNPKIYGNIVVWQDYRNGNWDIFMKNLITNKFTSVCNNPSTQINPAIYGNRIVWQDQRNGNWDIYMKNIVTGVTSQITSNSADQINPTIYGNQVVWQDYRNGQWDIYTKNVATGIFNSVVVNSYYKANPAIFGNVVVWQEKRNNFFNIWMKNIDTNTKKQLSKNLFEKMIGYGSQVNPKIYGNTVVWSTWETDGVVNYYDIWMTNIKGSATVKICSNVNYRLYPTVYGNRIVWQNSAHYLNGSDWDVYTKTFWPLYFETTPKDMEMLFPKTENIVIKFSEPINYGTNFNYITVTDTDTNQVTNITKSISGSILTLHNVLNRIPGHYYLVYIPKTAVKDSDNNTLQQNYSFSFRTTP